jgi:glutathione S-transferase
MIELYYAPASIYGRKVLAVLEEKGLDYTIKKMTFAGEDHKKPEYLKLNPNGEIPTLVDDGQVIYESTAIIEYLNDEYPEPPLMPEESYARACVRMVEDYCDLHLYRASVKCLIKIKYKGETLTDEDKASVAACVKRLEAYLGKQEYIAGAFSLADCAVMPIIPTLEGLGMGALLSSSDTIKKYVERLKKRPGYKGANLVSLEAEASTAAP